MTTDPTSERLPSPAVGGVVVTYHPDAGFETRLAAIAQEVAALIVVDNSATETDRARLADGCAALGCQLMDNSENRGLGAALNLGFATLAARGLTWAIAFDQDSTPEPGLSRALLATAAQSAAKPVALVGANWTDEGRPDHPARHLQAHGVIPGCFRRSAATRDLSDVTCVIASGTMFHLPTAQRLGGFDEGLFLDLVDTDYCLRARAAGYTLRVAAAARLRHRRGAKRPVTFAGRTWWPAFMPESRLHGLFRNRLLVFRRTGWRFPHWASFEIAYATKILAEIVFLEDRKSAKLAACLRGTWAGSIGSRPHRFLPETR